MIQFVEPINNLDLLKSIEHRIELLTEQRKLWQQFRQFYITKFEFKEINKRMDTALQKESWANVKIKTGPDSEISLVRSYLSQDYLWSVVFLFYLPSDTTHTNRQEMRIYLGSKDTWGDKRIKNHEELDAQNIWAISLGESIKKLQNSRTQVKDLIRLWNNALNTLKEVNAAAEPLGLEYDFDIKTR